MMVRSLTELMKYFDSKELMLPGDTFQLSRNDALRLTGCDDVLPISHKKIVCKVLSIYLKSSFEVRYLCGYDRKTFVLAQFLEDFYQVSTKSPEGFNVSEMVLVEASGRLGVSPASDILPMCYRKEDAEAIAQEIQRMELKERHGYLIPA